MFCLQVSLISKRYCGRLSRKKIYESYIWKVEFPLRRSRIYYQPKSKVRNQNSSKAIDDVFFLFFKWLHSFLCCIYWDWWHLSSKCSLYFFLFVLDECKCFLEVNLIKESSSLIETLLKPDTPSLDDKMSLIVNLIILLSNFL